VNYDGWRDGQILIREAVRRHRASEVDGDSRGRAPLVSVVVVCWNAAEVLGRCLDHLFAQDYPNYEVIVVDDGSEDTTEQVAQKAARQGELKIVRSGRNHGCPSARNLGLRHAAGEIVAFIDADGFADARWLSEVVKAFGADASIGGIASTVFFDDNPLVLNGAGGTVNQQGWAADLSMNESYEVAELASEALYPMGCGMAVRREAIERVGPFDDRMLNYYDDVDYGARLWRAGYRLKVAAGAWIDHGFGASAGDSGRKRLLCERHRMRVVLKHAPMDLLSRWAAQEVHSLRIGPGPLRVQKLRSIAWNLLHLSSTLASRWRLRRAPRAPDRLVDGSWGDGFPVGVAVRQTPVPERADADVHMDDRDVAGLLHGWFPPERVEERGYRWAGMHAAVLVHLDDPGGRLHLDYAHVPVDIGPIDVSIRRAGPGEPLAPVWSTSISWQYIARSVENHPLALEPGDYEVVFRAARGWSDPPHETRSLALALSRLTLARSFDIPVNGLDMASPVAENQLVSGWFEAEDSPDGRYRWAAGRAAAVVRLAAPARSAQLSYRLPPRSTGSLQISLSRLRDGREFLSQTLAWDDSDWQEHELVVDVPAGDYLLSLRTERTWSNPEGGDPELPPEGRSLGFALRALSFAPGP
jgi:GT2 family glycosyltransferase